MSIVDFLQTVALDAVFKVLGAILVLIIGFAVVKWVGKLVKNSKAAKKMEPGSLAFLVSILSVALKILVIFTVAVMVGVPSASIVALIGSAGLAVGLALQGSLANFAGGIMIMIFKPFVIGDYIKSAAGDSGNVTDINIFYTSLNTVDNQSIVIPNATLSNNPITNFTKMEVRRVDRTFSAAYKIDSKKVISIIEDVAKKNPLVLQDMDIFVKILSLDDSCITYGLRVWTKTGNYWDCYHNIYEEVKNRFDEENVEIPFPQLEIHTKA